MARRAGRRVMTVCWICFCDIFLRGLTYLSHFQALVATSEENIHNKNMNHIKNCITLHAKRRR